MNSSEAILELTVMLHTDYIQTAAAHVSIAPSIKTSILSRTTWTSFGQLLIEASLLSKLLRMAIKISMIDCWHYPV